MEKLEAMTMAHRRHFFSTTKIPIIQQIIQLIIQHIATLPKYGKKLSMYVGPHDVYPTIDVNFSMLTRECKNKKLVDNIFLSNFVLLSMC